MVGYTEYKISWFLKTKVKERRWITRSPWQKKNAHIEKKCLPRKSKVTNQFNHLHYSEINKSYMICSVENNNPKWCELNFERVTNGKLKTKCTKMRNAEKRMSRLDELQSSNEWNPSVAAPHSGGVRNKFFKFGFLQNLPTSLLFFFKITPKE